jgi:Ca2+-binding RTX toxin-like protein
MPTASTGAGYEFQYEDEFDDSFTDTIDSALDDLGWGSVQGHHIIPSEFLSSLATTSDDIKLLFQNITDTSLDADGVAAYDHSSKNNFVALSSSSANWQKVGTALHSGGHSGSINNTTSVGYKSFIRRGLEEIGAELRAELDSETIPNSTAIANARKKVLGFQNYVHSRLVVGLDGQSIGPSGSNVKQALPTLALNKGGGQTQVNGQWLDEAPLVWAEVKANKYFKFGAMFGLSLADEAAFKLVDSEGKFILAKDRALARLEFEDRILALEEAAPRQALVDASHEANPKFGEVSRNFAKKVEGKIGITEASILAIGAGAWYFGDATGANDAIAKFLSQMTPEMWMDAAVTFSEGAVIEAGKYYATGIVAGPWGVAALAAVDAYQTARYVIRTLAEQYPESEFWTGLNNLLNEFETQAAQAAEWVVQQVVDIVNANDLISVVGSTDIHSPSQWKGTNGNDLIWANNNSDIKAGQGNDWIIHVGNGEVRGEDGNDVIAFWAPKAEVVAPGPPEQKQALSLGYGGAGNDILASVLGEGAYLYGGAGEDTLVGLGGENHLFGGGEDGRSDGEQDLFVTSSHTFIHGAGTEDKVFWGPMGINGGIEQWWMEGGWAAWTPITGVVGASPLPFMMAFGAIAPLAVVAFSMDVLSALMFQFRRTESGQLYIQHALGLAGFNVIEDYELDIETGKATGGIVVFKQGLSHSGSGIQQIENYVNLALKAGFGHGLTGDDPLILDLDGDGYDLVRRGVGQTYFDFDGDGFAERAAWVGSDDGLLARDVNANGKIDDISELFGNANVSGFTALAALDSNSDGVINASDASYADLRVWRDLDGDAVTDAGELQTLDQAGIASISLTNAAPTVANVRGNAVRAEGAFTRANGSTSKIGDVLLEVFQSDSRYLGDATISTEAAAAPGLKGYGNLADLRIAATADADLLEALETFAELPDGTSWNSVLASAEAILFTWAGVDAGSPAPLGTAGFNTAKLAFLEKYLGAELAPRDGAGAPTATNAPELNTTWKDVLSRAAIRLAVQGPWGSIFEGVSFDVGGDVLLSADATSLRDAIAAVIADLPTDPVAAEAAWTSNWAPALNALTGSLLRADSNGLNTDYFVHAIVGALNGASSPLTLNELVAGLDLKGVSLGGTGNDTLTRSASGPLTQTYVGGAGDDAMTGGVGQDVFVFGSNFGQDTISDTEYSMSGDRVRLSTLNPDDVAITRSGDNLVISVNGSTDKITILGQYAAPTYIPPWAYGSQPAFGVEDIQFADGTIYEAAQIALAVGTGTAAAETLTGTPREDMVRGLGGNDTLRGGDSGDLYFYTLGDGNDIIQETRTNIALMGQDVLYLLGGIEVNNVALSRAGASDDIVLTFTDGGAVTLDQQAAYSPLGFGGYELDPRIDAFFFTSGIGWSWQDLQQQVIATYTTDGNDITYGFGSPDAISSSAGDDFLSALDGNDVYEYAKGAGNDIIKDASRYVDTPFSAMVGSTGPQFDVVRFKGLDLADVSFSRPSAAADLLITITETGETLTIQGQFLGVKLDLFGLLGMAWKDRIESFEFGDATLTWEDVLHTITTGNADGNGLWGAYYADTLDGKEGADYLSGGDDGDTYLFGRGYGQDVIEDNKLNILTATADTLKFKSDVAVSDVRFSRPAGSNDILVEIIGTSDSIHIRDQYVVVETGPFGAQEFDRVERFEWIDGTVISWQALHQKIIDEAGTNGNDAIVGTHFDDTINGHGGDDHLIGGNGSDTYLFGAEAGDGHDTIEDNGGSILAGSDDRIVFGAGTTANDFAITRSGGGGQDVTFTHIVNGSSITIVDQFDYNPLNYHPDQIETFEFGDSTLWNTPDLMQAFLDRASTSGNDDISGFYTDDTLVGGSGNDTLRGADGADTYVFNAGFGQDTIIEGVGVVTYSDEDTIVFGAGINAADMQLSKNGGNLVISFAGVSDTITVEGQFVSAAYFGSWTDVELLHFDDGTEFTAEQIRNTIIAQSVTSGDDVINGFHTADTLAGSAGNDTLRGGSGSDTYLFNIGDGADIVEESLNDHPFLDGVDRIKFGAGIARTDVSFTRSGNDLLATIAGLSDTIRVRDHFLGGYKTVEFFDFADGTTVTRQSAEAGSVAAQSTSDNDTVIATNSADVLNGGLGNDRLEGRGGDDVYQFDLGSGQDVVLDDNSAADSANDVLAFGAGITPDMITLTRSVNLFDLTLSVQGTTDQVKIENQFKKYNIFISEWNLVERITFADGSAWTIDDIRARVLRESITEGADVINGFWTSEVIDGRGGDDFINGWGGVDRYVLTRDGGHDTVYADEDDVVVLGAGISLDDIAVVRVGNDIIATIIETGASMKVVGQFVENGLGHRYLSVASLELADGGILTLADLDDMAFQAAFTASNDTIVGTSRDELFHASAGNDYMTGGGGADVFTFGRGAGIDTVDDSIEKGPIYDAIKFGPGLTVNDIVFEGQDNDGVRSTAPTQLMIRIRDTADTLLIKGHYQVDPLGNTKRIEEFRFEDGTVLTYQNLDKLMTIGARTDGADDIYGLWIDDILDGGSGADTLTGGNGGDVYLFGRGYGSDTIVEFGNNADPTYDDTVRFGVGIAEEDLVFVRDGADLVINIHGGSDQLRIKNQFNYNSGPDRYWIERFELSDGASITAAGMRQRLIDLSATAAADTLTGYYGSQTLDGLIGNDTLRGIEDDDIYIIGRNAGADIVDDSGLSSGDVVKFKQGIAPSDVAFNRLENSLYISIAGSTDTVTVLDQFASTPGGNFLDRIEYFDFADGARLDYNQIYTMTLTSTLNGTSGNDTLSGNNIAEMIDGINGLAGNDTISGRAGNDQLNGGDGVDTVFGGDGADTINGGDGDDLLHGENGNDQIFGGAGDDVMTGGGDVDAFDGGDGVDTLDSSAHTQSVNVDLDAGTIFYVGFSVTEAILNIEKVITSDAVDSIIGSSADNVINAAGGNDTLSGLAGSDRLDGGGGVDTMTGGLGDDTFVVDTASDVTNENAAEGVDTIETGITLSLASLPNIENIVLTGGDAINATGHAGSNTLVGNSGVNRIEGGGGNDTISGGLGADVYRFDVGFGQDTIEDNGQSGEVDRIEFLTYNAADVTLGLENGGVDLVISIAGSTDKITVRNYLAAAQNDWLEEIHFANGTIWNRATIESQLPPNPNVTPTIVGTNGNDVLGGTGADDIFEGKQGNDTLNSFFGNDGFLYRSGDGNDFVNEDSASTTEIDTLYLPDIISSGIELSHLGNDLFIRVLATGQQIEDDEHFWSATQYYGLERIVFSDGEVWNRAVLDAAWIRGGAGADTLSGFSGADTFFGGLGADVLNSLGGSDTFVYRSGDGNDFINEDSGSTSEVDTLHLVDVLSSGVELRRSGNDAIIRILATGHEIENDEFFYNTSHFGVDQIKFGDGEIWNRSAISSNAWIRGSAAAEALGANESGDETYFGGLGADTIYSGAGNDTFVWRAGDGNDVVSELDPSGSNTDTLRLLDVAATGVTVTKTGFDLFVHITATDETLQFRDHFWSSVYGIEQISFSDAIIWDRAEIASRIGLPPIVFDLDGDGVELVSRSSSNVFFDTDNDGVRQRTGWVGRDDGLLALDRNGDGMISSGNEISFIGDAPTARTDLEGLAAFDTNHNGWLDAGDKGFSQFRIWRDDNQDGVSQRKELTTLSKSGVNSIDLSPSSIFERTPGAQDNAILATTEFVRRDGSIGIAADVVLSFDWDTSAAAQPKAPKRADRTRFGKLANKSETAVREISSLLAAGSFLDRFGLMQGSRFADRYAAMSADSEISIVDRGDLPSTTGKAAHVDDLVTGMYGRPQLETEIISSPQSMAYAAASESASDPRLTMYGEPELETATAPAARELLDAIRRARYVAPVQGGWGADRYAQLPQEDSASYCASEAHAALHPSSLKRSPTIYDREVLLIVEAMAGFNATPAGEISAVGGRVPFMNLTALAADLRAA